MEVPAEILGAKPSIDESLAGLKGSSKTLMLAIGEPIMAFSYYGENGLTKANKTL